MSSHVSKAEMCNGKIGYKMSISSALNILPRITDTVEHGETIKKKKGKFKVYKSVSLMFILILNTNVTSEIMFLTMPHYIL